MVWVILGAVAGVVVLLLLVAIVCFNTLRAAEQDVMKDYNNIQAENARKVDLIPNLVRTVREYAAHERAVLDEVTAARAAAQSVPSDPGHASDVAQAQGGLTAALGRLFAVAEAYPDLKADANYRQLQAELTDTEDRIAASRKLYNSSVDRLNTKARTFPTNLFTGMAGVGVAKYYELRAEVADQARGMNISEIQ